MFYAVMARDVKAGYVDVIGYVEKPEESWRIIRGHLLKVAMPAILIQVSNALFDIGEAHLALDQEGFEYQFSYSTDTNDFEYWLDEQEFGRELF